MKLTRRLNDEAPLTGADPGILEGVGGGGHANAEGMDKNEKYFFAPKVCKKWKSACQISVFLASGTKIQVL